jgi:CheY-like chemotaxis protein
MSSNEIKPRIAVLEDHEDTRELLRISLSEEFTVIDFSDAATLLDAMQREKFSAIVADIMLPGLDGYDFVRAVRRQEQFRDLCVIAVTAMARPDDREKAMAEGFTEYLVKPIGPSEISKVIWRCLEETSRR